MEVKVMTVKAIAIITDIEERGKGKRKVNVCNAEVSLGKTTTLTFKAMLGKDVDIDDIEDGGSYSIEGFTTYNQYKNKDGYDCISETLYISKLK